MVHGAMLPDNARISRIHEFITMKIIAKARHPEAAASTVFGTVGQKM